ncbi:MAG TPA: hypothetical protein PLZ52_08890 [Bacteroidales bacterium]|nr:hypothetical protein [Bacteroidales bacterium]
MNKKLLLETIQGIETGCKVHEDTIFGYAFASDLMSDVLRTDAENMILVTGLCNLQTIRTAEMADIKCVILGRGKKASGDMIELACENEIAIVESPFSVFRICSELSRNGIKYLY